MDNDGKLVSSIEDDPIVKELPRRTTFIPIRHYDLKRILIDHFCFDDQDRGKFLRLCSQLQSHFHIEQHSALLRLEEIYEQLDPDTQLAEVDHGEQLDREQLSDHLIDCVSGVLYSAHYKRLTQAEIERAVDVGWQWGVKLDVDFELFDRLEIFARGYRTVTVTRRRWQNFFRLETIELPEFTRLIMAFRIKEGNVGKRKSVLHMLDPRFVYLKTFKNIPETEVEILLPGSKVKLTRFDRAKILFPTISGMAITAYKLARSALLLGLAFSLETWFGFAVLIGGGVGYIVKSVLSYFRTKNEYQFGLTKNLYLKNLDNNLSVLYRILHEAEEQEVSEVVLAYVFLWRQVDRQVGVSAAVLDRMIEAFVEETVNIDVNFEIHDALGKLARLGLAHVDHEGRWTCVAIDEAARLMQKNWSQLYSYTSGINYSDSWLTQAETHRQCAQKSNSPDDLSGDSAALNSNANPIPNQSEFE